MEEAAQISATLGAINWPASWRTVPLWSLFERIKDVGHPDEEMLSVYRNYGVVKKESRDDNFNKTAENREIYQLVDKGWLIVNRMKAWQGSVGISPYRGIASGHYLCFRPKHNEDSRFLNWMLRSDAYAYEYARLSRGVRPNQIEIDNDELRILPVRLPAVEEQQRIANFLDIEIARIDELASATVRQELLTAERFIEWITRQTTNPLGKSVKATGIQWMPWIAESWTLHKVGRVFRSGSGTTPKSTNETYFGPGIPWLNTGDLSDGPVRAIAKSVTPEAMRDFPALRVFHPGSLVIAMYGATIGRLGLLESDACTNQACCVLYDGTAVDPLFAFYWFMAYRQSIMTLASGGGQPNISQDLIRSLRIPAPPLPDQRSLATRIRSAEAHLSRQRCLLARRQGLLAERRQALITAAVTGQFDVTTARGADLS